MSQLKKLLALLITFFLLVPCIVYAGTTGKIAGTVTDQTTGAPLPGANILIQGSNRGASADEEGYYSIINLKPGTYNLVVRFIGYAQLVIEDVEVSVDRTTRVDAELIEETLEISEVVVRASRPPIQKDRTYSASVVNTSTIQAMPVTSLQEVIALQPGVVSSGGELHFRGGRTREVAYLIDGIPVTNAFSQGGGNNVVIENSMVQELEVISGTFNAEYGAAQSGIVNVITKGVTDKFSGNVRFYAGDWLSDQTDIYIGVDDFNPVSEKDVQFSLAGPILRDRLGISFSGRYNNSSSLEWYERRYNPIDGWRIAAYERWFQEQRADQVDALQGIPIPDSLKTGDGEQAPLAEFESVSFNTKLNFYPIPEINLSYQVFGSWSEQVGSTSSYNRYQPDERATYRNWSHHHFVSLRHSPSDKFFYNLGFSFQFNDGESIYREDNKIAEYPGDTGIQPIGTSADGFSLGNTAGFYTDAEGKNFRELYLVNGSINWQVDKYNFLKAGFEYKRHNINTYSWGYVQTQDWSTKMWQNFDPNPNLTFEDYWETMVDYWRNWNTTFDTTKYRRVDESEFTQWRDYTIEPQEFAVYLQDKVELGEIIINGGLRMDIFFPNEKVPADYTVESLLLGAENNLVDATNKVQFSPRLGVSFPISDRGVFHAAYGHFFQMPSFEKMYNQPLYTLTPIQLEGRLLGNADLEPEKTVQYEIGLQQQITDDVAVDITAYYKDIKNLLGIERVTTQDAVGYTRFINRDYGNSKGITFGLRKTRGFITGAINYTLSFANGSSSDPEALQLVETSTQIGGQPVQFIDRKILPLNWDQRHTLNVILTLSRPRDWSVGLVSYLNSGLPYSPDFLERFDIPEREFKNQANKPIRWSVDLKAKKYFELGGLEYVLFLKIDNLIDHLNQSDVYSTSGTADENARLPEQEGLELERLEQEGHFTLDEVDNRPEWYSSPRKIELGLEVYF